MDRVHAWLRTLPMFSYANVVPPVAHVQTPEQSIELLAAPTRAKPERHDEYTTYIHDGNEDMQVIGYATHTLKKTLVWIAIVTTIWFGGLRLIFHWYPKWYLQSTSRRVSIDAAETLLIIEMYKGKQIFHIRHVKTRTIREPNAPRFISTHVGGAQFQHADQLKYFTVKKLMFVWDCHAKRFEHIKGLDCHVSGKQLHECQPLDVYEHEARKWIYGANEIVIPKKSVIELLFLETLYPFNIFQLFSFCLWFADQYHIYATTILTLTAYGVIDNVRQIRKNQKQLEGKVHTSSTVKCLRRMPQAAGNDAMFATTELNVSTNDLVLGDIIQVTAGEIMRCDAVLIKGDCIVNESMLTGESVPVTKNNIGKVDVLFDAKEHARHTLFCGTHVIQTRSMYGEPTYAIVIRTGYATTKGGLIRSILYPPPVDYRFEQDSYKFIAILGLVALMGFFYTFYTRVSRGASIRSVLFDALDLVTIVVPPALPTAMAVGRASAEKRLRKMKIFCISPRSINVAGSVDCICFDKTGTLTEDGLDVLGVVPVRYKYFQVIIANIADMTYDNLMFALATCHSLTIVDDKIVGEPLEVKIFESTRWSMEESAMSTTETAIFSRIVRPPPNRRQNVPARQSTSTEMLTEAINTLSKFIPRQDDEQTDIFSELFVGISKEFPFSNSLQRMSVIVKRNGSRHFELFCKGSPEMIVSLTKPGMIPDDFDDTLKQYTSKGYRVIAVAHRKLVNMRFLNVIRAERDELEKDLEMLGLVILENRLKQETTPTIAQLHRANMRTVMITGDNLLTAVSVAKDCGIIRDNEDVITVDAQVDAERAEIVYSLKKEFQVEARADVHLTRNGCVTNGSIWSGNDVDVVSVATVESTVDSTVPVDNGNFIIELDNNFCESQRFILKPMRTKLNKCFVLAGNTWSVIMQHHPELIPRIIEKGAVFARMSSDQKQSLVYELQSLGYVVAMVGDGANDVGALRTAHCGISLSDTEASVAAPFTSGIPNITAVKIVINQGRGALATSFSLFKFMAVYSLIQFASVILHYDLGTNFGDYQFLYIDLFLITPLSYVAGKAVASTKALYEARPQSSLISFHPIASILIQTLLSVCFQRAALWHLTQQTWYEPLVSDEDKHAWCVENYVIFIVSSFHYICAAVIMFKGGAYRKPLWTHRWLVFIMIVATVFTTYLALVPSSLFVNIFELTLPPEPRDTIVARWSSNHSIVGGATTLNDSFVGNLNDSIATPWPMANDSFGLDFDVLNATQRLDVAVAVNDAFYIFSSRTLNTFQYVILAYAVAYQVLSLLLENFLLDRVMMTWLVPRFQRKLPRDEDADDWPVLSNDYRGSSPTSDSTEMRRRTIIMGTRQFALQESAPLDQVLHKTNVLQLDWRDWLKCVMDNEEYLRKTADRPIPAPFMYKKCLKKVAKISRRRTVSLLDLSTIEFLRLRPTPPISYFFNDAIDDL